MKILDRLYELAGFSKNPDPASCFENEKVEVEESRGLSEENFKALTPTQQIKYIKEHPHSKYGRDPKWLKRAKMLKTRMMNMKKAKMGEKPNKNVPAKTGKKSVSLKDLKKVLSDPKTLKYILDQLNPDKEKAKKTVKDVKKKLSEGKASGDKEMVKEAVKTILPAIKGLGIVKGEDKKPVSTNKGKPSSKGKPSIKGKPSAKEESPKKEKVVKNKSDSSADKPLTPEMEKKVKDTEDILKSGTYKIKFKTVGGEEREIIGSMEDEWLKKMNFSKDGKIKKKNPHVVAFINTELDPPQFRSFRIENLQSMEKVDGKKARSEIKKANASKVKNAKDASDKLSKGTFNIKFTKADGSTREMVGSMEDKWLKKLGIDRNNLPHKGNPNVVDVVDTKLNPPALRSFRIDRLQSMEEKK